MATITSAASGNFADGATWVGGVPPGIGDNAVAAAGHTVTIAADAACDNLQTTGGQFKLADGVTFTGNVAAPGGDVNTLLFDLDSPAAATIVGNVPGSMRQGWVNVWCTGSGTLTIRGNLTGLIRGCLTVAGDGLTLNVTGDVTFSTNPAISVQTGRVGVTVNITGAILHVGTSILHAVSDAGADTVINLVGSVQGAAGSTGAGIGSGGAAVVTVTGSIHGHTGTGAGVRLSHGGASLSVTGAITGGGGTGAAGVYRSGAGAGIMDIAAATLTMGGGDLSHAVRDENTGSGYTLASGDWEDAANGSVAICARRLVLRDKANHLIRLANIDGYPTGTKLIRASLDYAADMPAEADVRSGTQYADAMYTGIMAVPPAASVGVGVPVGDAVGTAALSPEDVWTYVERTLTAGGLTLEQVQQAFADALAAYGAASVEAVGDLLAAATLT